MPLPVRSLRPQASAFDPRLLSGCICNLDASELVSLKQNSDGTTGAVSTDNPVGYWEDLSGKGNHAKQTVATGSRPLLKLNDQNGKPGLLFDGSNDWMTASVAGFQSLSASTVIQVVKPSAAAAADTNSAAFWGFGNLASAGGSFPANRGLALSSSTGALSGERITVAFDNAAINTGRLGSSSYSRAASTVSMISMAHSSSGTVLYANDAQVSLNLSLSMSTSTNSGPSATAYTVDDDVHICALRASGSIVVSPAITLHQMIIYDRALTAAELSRIYDRLKAKWGL
jgi:hypothetical protein